MLNVSTVRPPPVSSPPRNKLLACLSEADLRRLRPLLRTIELQPRQIIHRRNEPVTHAMFLNGGVASMTAVMEDGRMVEVATVGNEGLLGSNALFGADMIGAETMLQVPDMPVTTAEIIALAALKSELDRQGALFACVQRYSHGLLTLMMHSTACIAFHTVLERCSRWLLMAHDRIRRDEFDLSHEFLAMMLGSTRPTVTDVAGALQNEGLIQYKHGHITILDRKGLESTSCECYRTVKAHFDRLQL